eukprot:119060-Pyramimonas_sp.AAC.1
MGPPVPITARVHSPPQKYNIAKASPRGCTPEGPYAGGQLARRRARAWGWRSSLGDSSLGDSSLGV